MVVKNYGSDPATLHYAVVSSNTANLNPVPRALYVANSGTLTIMDSNGANLTYTVSNGQILPIRAVRVNTDSTANVIAWS